MTCSTLVLPVQETSPPPTAYSDFCGLNPVDCRPQGPAIVPATEPLRQQLQRVNREVNAAVRFMPDTESVGQEEDWRYPSNGRGDCEDIALEKRRRLVAWGVPRSALTMAIVHHATRYFSHAVLLVETSAGTWMLDSLSDDIACWDRTPFNFESRERSDGRWDRFDQSVWRQGPRLGAVPGPG
jgi:predicted transglutaminase-like cysteine proteinase